MTEEQELNQCFPVTLSNPYSYPIRVLTWMDEETGKSTFTVLKQFQSRPYEINRLTYEHLRRDPKVQVLADNNS